MSDLYRIVSAIPGQGELSVINPADELIGVLVPVEIEPEHRHQWLPWLTLPNGSSWTQCVPCGEQFQYDY